MSIFKDHQVATKQNHFFVFFDQTGQLHPLDRALVLADQNPALDTQLWRRTRIGVESLQDCMGRIRAIFPQLIKEACVEHFKFTDRSGCHHSLSKTIELAEANPSRCTEFKRQTRVGVESLDECLVRIWRLFPAIFDEYPQMSTLTFAKVSVEERDEVTSIEKRKQTDEC